MARFNKTLKTIMEAMNTSSKEKTKAYDTPATVLRVDGDTLWVHIDGGVDETPIKRTIDAKVGDVVQVRVGGGRAWATGNATAPPTDDTKAGIALEQTNAVSKTVKTVKTLVNKVMKIAGDTAQYFWHTQEGTDTGVHITEIPKEDFLADPENGGGNLLARSNGIAVRDGLTELAQFGAGLARVGQEDDSNVEITEESVKMYKDGLECVSFELPTEARTYVGNQFRNMYPTTLNVGDEISLFGRAPSQYDGKYCTFTYQGRSYKIERTQQGGYDTDDPSTYYYYGFDQTNNQVKFYSNADRTIIYNERLDARFYIEEYSAPSYVGCYPEKSVGTVFAVGNGTPTTPSNAFEVDYYGNATLAGKLTADLSNMITVEEKSITYSNSWTSVYKAGYRLLSVHAIRSDVDYIIQANRRSDGVYLLYAPNAGSASQTVELIWLKD